MDAHMTLVKLINVHPKDLMKLSKESHSQYCHIVIADEIAPNPVPIFLNLPNSFFH